MPRYTVNMNSQVVLGSSKGYQNGLRLVKATGGSYFLACCGLAGMEQFSYVPVFKDWQDKAEFIACVYRYLYNQGQVLYALTQNQLEGTAHKLFLELGAEKLGEFPNLYHGPNTIHLFKVNIRRACGRFCNKYGEAYAEPPKDASEVNPREDECHTNYGTLPQR